MKKIYLTLILVMFFISFASASISDLGTFKQNGCINLPQTCPACTYNNISRITVSPDSIEVLNDDVTMQKDGTFYNYTFCSTSYIGKYTVDGYGDLGGGPKINWNYYFTISPSGIIQGSIFENSVLIFMVIFSLMFMGLGIYFRIPSLGFMGSILMLLSGVYTMIYGFNNMADLYTRSVAGTLLGLGMIVMIVSAYEWMPWGGGDSE